MTNENEQLWAEIMDANELIHAMFGYSHTTYM